MVKGEEEGEEEKEERIGEIERDVERDQEGKMEKRWRDPPEERKQWEGRKGQRRG